MNRSPLVRKLPDPSTSVPVFRQRKCRAPGCENTFKPQRSLEKWCSFDCAAALGLQSLLKKDCRQKTREQKDESRRDKKRLRELEPISKAEKRAETAVNLYVRLRDQYLGYGCVSCDKSASWDGQWHASHFRSVGAATGVRYNLWNIHRACWICNKLYSGRIGEYAPVLIERIGMDKYEWLKAQNKPVRYSREYLERLRAVMAKKARRMKKRIEGEAR